MEISYEEFRKVKIHVGTVKAVEKNKRVRKPALALEIDFGSEIGMKKTSAQITDYYNENNLLGKQVIAVCNFPSKNIAGLESEVLVLGAVEKDSKVVLIHPSKIVANGLEII